ncbi:AGC protein kinase [Saprolegnia parasitica CBS 223.65]|uniref:AGC protein kinase n=1 Tax=Saprolegnia parasitica (strain CBS 223.65) TaxID=695850 RepID=A0A067CTM5_SAPPC|nr:AGC protein kinase [Saprolegnia parasitica CBS 223.65]KDO29886.1 AGC protein kinase [Saprolegnia parasitica CBS 223.65]|eukprot:XP_012199481.1 AGC protein kinase [Saprolegnia parasitica CBS 223.65]
MGTTASSPGRRRHVMELQSVFTSDGTKRRVVEKVALESEDDVVHMVRHAPRSPSTLSSTSTASSCVHGSNDVGVHDFETIKLIGAGSMGKVLLVRKKATGSLYAMKIVSKAGVSADQIWSERDVLGGTAHRGLVHLHYAFQSQSSLFLVMEYCPGGELATQIQAFVRFVQPIAMFYAAEIVLALEHLHRHGIAYRDLKPENLLLSADGHVKLVDFGLAKFGILEATRGTKTMCGSFEYLAPEVYEGNNRNGYGTAVDWFALGIVLYEMLTGLPPWYTDEPPTFEQLPSIRAAPLAFPAYVSPSARHLIRNLLVADPSQRLGSGHGALDIKSHPFFATIDWVALSYGELTAPLDPCEDPSCIDDARNFENEYTSAIVDPWEHEDDDNQASHHACDRFHGFSFEGPSLFST